MSKMGLLPQLHLTFEKRGFQWLALRVGTSMCQSIRVGSQRGRRFYFFARGCALS